MTTTSLLPVPTVSEIRQQILDAFTVYKPGDSTAEYSDAWVEANALAIQIVRLALRDSDVAAWISVNFATGDKLDDHGIRWLPADARRKAATHWVGKMRLRATSGTPTVPAGQTGTHSAGAAYIMGEVLPADWSVGYAIVGAAATTAGTIANQSHLALVTLSSPPVGVSAAAELYVDADTVEAEDREGDDSYRQRILAAMAYRPASGNWAHYKEWAESVEGVSEAYVYPRFFGLTTCLVIPVGPPGGRVVVAQTIVDVILRMAEEGVRPVACIPTIWQPTPTSVAVDLTITPKLGYEPSWTGALTTDTDPTPAANRFKTTTDPTIVLGSGAAAVGKRVVVPVVIGGARTTQERVVSSVDSTTKIVIASEDFGAVPAASETVTPGGPLWQPARDAVQAVFDNLGPARETTGNAPRRPSWLGEHPSKLWLSDLMRAVDSVTGVHGVTISAPATNQDPTCTKYGASVPILLLDPEVLISWSTT